MSGDETLQKRAAEDSESEDEDEEDEVEDPEAVGKPIGIAVNGMRASSPPPDEADGLGESFGGMSISPARPACLQQSQILVTT